MHTPAADALYRTKVTSRTKARTNVYRWVLDELQGYFKYSLEPSNGDWREFRSFAGSTILWQRTFFSRLIGLFDMVKC